MPKITENFKLISYDFKSRIDDIVQSPKAIINRNNFNPNSSTNTECQSVRPPVVVQFNATFKIYL